MVTLVPVMLSRVSVTVRLKVACTAASVAVPLHWPLLKLAGAENTTPAGVEEKTGVPL